MLIRHPSILGDCDSVDRIFTETPHTANQQPAKLTKRPPWPDSVLQTNGLSPLYQRRGT
jgi:hypothetical protein